MQRGLNCMASSKLLTEFRSTPTSLFPEIYASMFASNMSSVLTAMLLTFEHTAHLVLTQWYVVCRKDVYIYGHEF